MTTLREAAQQALEAWQVATYGHPSHHKATLLAMTALRAALAQEEPWTPAKLGDALVQWVDASALAQEEQPNRAQQMRDAGHTRRPTLREMAQEEQEPVAQMRGNALARWAHEQEEPPDTDWQRGYEAARRWVRQVGLPSLAQQDVPETNFGNMEREPVAWTDRELELIDGMIEVQLRHAAQCDAIANRAMAEKQKGWDMERVALLRKIKSISPRREMVAATRAAQKSTLEGIEWTDRPASWPERGKT